MIEKKISRTQFMMEVAGKNIAIFVLYFGVYLPLSIDPLSTMPEGIQESVISLMGFLMAAAIIGAFEMSYTATNLFDTPQRVVAHLTKFTLYFCILMLMEIAMIAISVTGGDFFTVLIVAAFPIAIALFLYDGWDAMRAADSFLDHKEETGTETGTDHVKRPLQERH